ncbi:MAG: MlaD family protein [candidate division KSB1 bacterium]|nr:MlaD family protein [candidate division KSB1 bacterium]MDZ7367780.1 MlaD family protein [candidate division KSB1 bacterium]MDZ7406629.1 MlaD family protein [candidate division KSB1 bacterium]
MSYEARVGIVIVIAILILFFGVMYLREYSFSKKEYEITAIFDTVIGLDQQDPVIVSGLKIGQTKEMQLAGVKVEVRLLIDSRYEFPRDSKAVLRNLTLLGDKAIEIVRGTANEKLKPGDVIAGTLETDFFELAEAAAPIGEDIAVLLKRFRSTFDENTEASLKGSLRNLNTISGAVAEVVVKDMGEIETAIVSLRTAAKNLERLTAPEGRSIQEVIANLDSSSGSLKNATARFDRAAGSIENLLGKIERGEGSLGKLIQSDTLYRNLEKFTQHLDLLILDVKKHPQKYIKIELF